MHQRMAALIQGCLHINPDELEEDEFVKMWGRAKYIAQTLYQCDFK